MAVLYTLRMFIWFGYFFGYMVVHLPALRRGERALSAGDTDEVRRLVNEHIPRWCSTLMKIGGVTMEVQGRENIPTDRPCVFVANHRSYFDIPVMLTALDAPHGILAKQEIDKIPLVRSWMRLLGCVFVVRDSVTESMRALNTATDTVKKGQSFVIFPEGTRYKGEEGGIGEFKGGAFRIATKTGAPVVPVVIHHSRDAFENHRNVVTPAHIVVEILPPIDTSALDRPAQKALPATVQQVIEEKL